MEYLDERINLRMTPSDKDNLLKKATEKKLSLSAYCRSELVKDLLK